ncbi:hypothetical protein TNIN_448291 [Trichonephila inaurata madagascariensis]|uniref:Uncharacterized protein n=1 Tax=Trichonephila inaurata madagascariensis TaxID=2747483 RepID=A0A8X6XVT6_9ARAC|nr:hypothetical protein TNIN_448291 [Trichonephila inaurata madagascariensis]
MSSKLHPTLDTKDDHSGASRSRDEILEQKGEGRRERGLPGKGKGNNLISGPVGKKPQDVFNRWQHDRWPDDIG